MENQLNNLNELRQEFGLSEFYAITIYPHCIVLQGKCTTSNMAVFNAIEGEIKVNGTLFTRAGVYTDIQLEITIG